MKDRDVMLKLKNVSKFYYNKGVIASGFTKVNAEFNIGNGKVINVNSSNLPTVVYILNTLKINDNIINKDNYMNYFDSNITVIFN